VLSEQGGLKKRSRGVRLDRKEPSLGLMAQTSEIIFFGLRSVSSWHQWVSYVDLEANIQTHARRKTRITRDSLKSLKREKGKEDYLDR